MEELLQYALELTKDSAVAERIVREASTQTADEAERRRLVTEAAEAHRRAEASRRAEAWKAMRPKAALVGLPVVAAFAIGLVTGTTAGMVRLPAFDSEPDTLVPGAPELAGSFGSLPAAQFQHAADKTFTIELPASAGSVALLLQQVVSGAVEVDVNGRPLELYRNEVVIPPEVLVPGKNTLHIRGRGGWAVSSLKLTRVPVRGAAAESLIAEAAEREAHAAQLLESELSARRYHAFVALRDAAVMLAAAHSAKRADVRQKLDAARDVLDRLCNEFLDEARTAEPTRARLTLELLADEFPGSDHGCRGAADALRAERGL